MLISVITANICNHFTHAVMNELSITNANRESLGLQPLAFGKDYYMTQSVSNIKLPCKVCCVAYINKTCQFLPN